MRTKTLRLTALLAAGCLACGAEQSAALSLFGFGKKKAKPETKEEAKPGEPKTEEKGELTLPGISEETSPDLSAPPRMAQEQLPEGEKGRGEEPARLPEPPAEEPDASAKISDTETAIGDHPASLEGGMPAEVTIRASGGAKLKAVKPALNIIVDSFESIRDSLKPDQNLLLAESPLAVVWRRTHPEFLKNPRVIQPWRTTFSERAGIVFRPRDQLAETLQRKLEDKEARGFQWSLTLADEEGKVFQHYEGSSNPPEELVWSGQNDQSEWIKAGRAYSPVYLFTDPGGTPYTRVGKPLRFKGIVHQERTGLQISLDSSILFGKAKAAETLQSEGDDLIRSAADLIKRRYPGLPIRVEAYSGSKELAERQAAAVASYLTKELMLLPQDINSDSLRVPFGDQRVEVVLVNR